MDTLEFFTYEFASYTAIDADIEDVETYLTELIDYDVTEYGPTKHCRLRGTLDP